MHPAEEEMPSLDLLKINPNFDNLVIFPINVEVIVLKSQKIFYYLKINNLEIYFDSSISLAKDFLKRDPIPYWLARMERNLQESLAQL